MAGAVHLADRVDVQRVPALAASVILQAVEQRPEPLGYAHPAQRDGLLWRYPNSHEDSFSSLRPAGAEAFPAPAGLLLIGHSPDSCLTAARLIRPEA